MNEVIASILDAEQKAEEIVKLSLENSKKIKQDADFEADKIKNSAVTVFKIHRSAVLKDAEKKAEELYEKTIEDGKSYAEKIFSDAEKKAEKISDEIVKDIIG